MDKLSYGDSVRNITSCGFLIDMAVRNNAVLTKCKPLLDEHVACLRLRGFAVKRERDGVEIRWNSPQQF